MCGCLCCKKRINDEKISASILDKELGSESSTSLPTRFSSSAKLFPPSISKMIQLVGKGAFGKVMLVKYLENNKIYGIKILKKEEIIKKNQVNHTKTERFLLEKLNHPFIAKLKYAFQDDQKLYLVTEFIQGGMLYFHFKKNSYFKEKDVKFYMSQILLALEYLLNNGYIYRDFNHRNRCFLLGKRVAPP
jgi:serine/threonine protein kinase